MQEKKALSYKEYLQLDKILTSQKEQSGLVDKAVHDEMLFIITHQTYELWFKQIHHELDKIFKDWDALLQIKKDASYFFEIRTPIQQIEEKISRVIEIFKVLSQQVGILETMNPVDFLDFRDLLAPASGLQSFQFRLMEAKLGMTISVRTKKEQEMLEEALGSEQYKLLDVPNNVMNYLSQWGRILYDVFGVGQEFWESYKASYVDMLRDRQNFEGNKQGLKYFGEGGEELVHMMDYLLNKELFEKVRNEKSFKLNYESTWGLLMVYLYADFPDLYLPFSLMQKMMDLDECISLWRHRHALMALRMVGGKIGTGGSSGYQYLAATVARGQLFPDLFHLVSVVLPRKYRPSFKMPD